NVKKIKLLGANVKAVTEGNATLKEAVDVAFKYYLENRDVFYLIGSAVGPAPYPEMVKYFQKVIGEEAHKQILEQEAKMPKAVVACVGGGSNSIGLYSGFLDEDGVEIFGVEGAGKGLETGKHASAIYADKIGVLHGMKTNVMQDENGNVLDAYSISAGLDYPGIGPEHAFLNKTGRVKYDSVTDDEALNAFTLLTKKEGIIPALESSHAVAYALKIAKSYEKDDVIIVNLSGRGDKDLDMLFDIIK
ncbi:MAG: pyridoxal-phosphate dependent enzyme, partial [Clostridia bacterium]|nr:pyridoxal-phosphate dependent enzyme [Clostridia bacterium]